jgi:two-component system chemotaxis response regulator CheY
MKILVVEDEPASAHLVEHTVHNFGHEALIVPNAGAAWEALQTSEWRIIISDWMMPGEDGLSLCRRIRAAALPFYAYIIILTARTERQDLLDALSAGADDFLVKPLDPDELRVRLLVGERIVGLETRLRQANDALRKYAADLDQLSKVDALMGIGNRAAFEARLCELQAWAREGGRSFGIVMCDVDHFKVYNDSLGHQRGDQILRQVADAVKRGVRATDRAFRYGGEEIVLLLPDVDVEGAAHVAERVRRQVQGVRFELDGTDAPFRITISCGVASYPDYAQGPADALGPVETADHALYEAKRRGRNRVVRADELRGQTEWSPKRRTRAEEDGAKQAAPPIQ